MPSADSCVEATLGIGQPQRMPHPMKKQQCGQGTASEQQQQSPKECVGNDSEKGTTCNVGRFASISLCYDATAKVKVGSPGGNMGAEGLEQPCMRNRSETRRCRRGSGPRREGGNGETTGMRHRQCRQLSGRVGRVQIGGTAGYARQGHELC